MHDNRAKTLGGGIYSRYSKPRIDDNLIHDNLAGFRGGGIYCRGSEPAITNITITRNDARKYGGGVCFVLSESTIRNAIIWENTADKNSEIPLDRSKVTVRYSDIQGGWQGPHNIDKDPLFADFERGDFSLGAESPCIDAGEPESHPDRDGSIVDMGARFLNWREEDQ